MKVKKFAEAQVGYWLFIKWKIGVLCKLSNKKFIVPHSYRTLRQPIRKMSVYKFCTRVPHSAASERSPSGSTSLTSDINCTCPSSSIVCTLLSLKPQSLCIVPENAYQDFLFTPIFSYNILTSFHTLPLYSYVGKREHFFRTRSLFISYIDL